MLQLGMLTSHRCKQHGIGKGNNFTTEIFEKLSSFQLLFESNLMMRGVCILLKLIFQQDKIERQKENKT